MQAKAVFEGATDKTEELDMLKPHLYSRGT